MEQMNKEKDLNDMTIEQVIQTSLTNRLREQAFRLRDRDVSSADIAYALNVSPRTLAGWLANRNRDK
jgi:hypothetical protein